MIAYKVILDIFEFNYYPVSTAFLYSWLILVPLKRSEPKFKVYCRPKELECHIFPGTSIPANFDVSLASCESECTGASLARIKPFVWMTFLFVFLAFHCDFTRTVLHSKLLSLIHQAWNRWFALQAIFAGRSASAARDYPLFFNFSIIKTEKIAGTNFVCYLWSVQFGLSINNMLYYSHGSSLDS